MLDSVVFKANDIRGVFGREWDDRGAWALGVAFGQVVGEPRVVVSRDMRLSGPVVEEAFVRGVTSQGVSVVDAGLLSTDGLWFASGAWDLPGVQITSSHNPSSYNGMKFCRRGAKPVTGEFLAEVRRRAQGIDEGRITVVEAQTPGTVEHRDVLDEYVGYLLSLVDVSGMRRLTVVVDAGNGMAGLTAPAVLSRLDVDMVGLFLELDGSFPNHQPNPLEPANLMDAQRAVVDHHADVGLVFDGDADRVFVIDERGVVVNPSAIAGMIAVDELARDPGGTVVVNTITSDAVGEIVAEHGGRVVVSRVGHTYMKALMASEDAVFGGEHSAHYYFRDFFGADTGMLAGLHVLSAVGHSDQPLSALVASYTRYVASGEINSTVADQQATMDVVARTVGPQGSVSWQDGVKISGDGWWVSLRPSNTEPLLRLNVEAADTATMEHLRDTVLALIKEEK